jgi:hypothetical protein
LQELPVEQRELLAQEQQERQLPLQLALEQGLQRLVLHLQLLLLLLRNLQ